MNIKALAEKIKAEHEQNHDAAWSVGHEYYFENYPEYSLASALLRVMEDAENLAKALTMAKTPLSYSVLDEVTPNVVFQEICEALESHNKLMEELGGE